jgi:hypothetical protein
MIHAAARMIMRVIHSAAFSCIRFGVILISLISESNQLSASEKCAMHISHTSFHSGDAVLYTQDTV